MPQASPDWPAVVRFGPFELDARAGELSRDGVRVRLQDHQLALLLRLIEHPGQVVTRDDLRARLWPHGTMVDFEHGVNTALKRLRDALGDEAEHPQYIETIPRRGYRFIAPVGAVKRPAARVGEPVQAAGPPVAIPVGQYRVIEPIGSGGMGEVFRGEDLALKRSVALKILPAAWGDDADRLARFQREAEVLAALNHPHIAAIYGLAEVEGRRCLVLELVHGETLAARLARGPMPLAQAVEVAAQIAEALNAAHKHGIIHRDLNPGNVMLAKGGSGRAGVTNVKLLDFGLAKLAGHGEQPAFVGDAAAPATTPPITGQGTVLGTLPYMAPEQLDGKEADARTDLWALGAVLHEMVTRRRAFEGDSQVSLIGNIMTAEPAALAALQPLSPPALERLVRKCLAKHPDDRWDSAHDVADELRWVGQMSGAGSPTLSQRRRRLGQRSVLVVAGIVVGVALGAGLMWLVRPSPPPPSSTVTRLSLDLRPAEEITAGWYGPDSLGNGGALTALAWTPDGQTLVFVGRRGAVRQLYVRRLDAVEARPLAGTEGATVPAVSSDGQWVVFWVRGSIKKVPLGGGPAVDLASGLPARPYGLSVDDHGRVLFGRDDGRIWQITLDGKLAAVTTVGDAEVAHVLPWPLPRGQTVLYTVRKREWTWGDEEVVAQTIAGGTRKVLLNDGADARYIPPGYLVFLRRGLLLAVPFDAERLEVRGPAVPVLDSVAQALVGVPSFNVTGAGQFAISSTGTLAWLEGPIQSFRTSALVVVDRRGKLEPLPAPLRSYSPVVRLSPDGRLLAVTIHSLTAVGSWVYNFARQTLTPITVDGEGSWPAWPPDGQRFALGMLRDGRRSLTWQPADATAPPEMVAPGTLWPSSWTPDGRRLALALGDTGDMAVAVVENGRARVQPLLQTTHSEMYPTFSPDGNWLVHGSNMSGRFEVYVRPYPGPGPMEQVSTDGGTDPAWNPNGRELLFVSPYNPARKKTMMAVSFEVGSPPRIGRPMPLFEFDPRDLRISCLPLRCYDVALDGQSLFLTKVEAQPPAPVVTQVNIVTNWLKELKAKVPVRQAK